MMISLHLTILLVMVAELPLLTCGLMCECIGDCFGHDTCDAGVRGTCVSQLVTDISGRITVLRKGCAAEGSVLCVYTESAAHKNLCCNETEFCNAEHFQGDHLRTGACQYKFVAAAPLEITCSCVGNSECKRGKCTILSSHKDSCYTTIRKLGSIITYERGCKTECNESHDHGEKTTCCLGDWCNTEQIPSEWPSPSSSAVTTSATSDRPTDLPTVPAATNEIIDISIFETEEPKKTDIDPRRPTAKYTCHCNQCRDEVKTCAADYACASYTIGSNIVTTCVHEQDTCNKTTFNVTCCYSNYCNHPSKSTGPPCDDEDTEQSGCESLVITSTPSTTIKFTSTTSTKTTLATSTTPSSSTRASPPVGRERNTDDDNKETVVVFYMFIVLLCVCVVIMVAMLIVCGVIVYYYRSLMTKQTMSSATVLESSIKVTSSSPS